MSRSPTEGFRTDHAEAVQEHFNLLNPPTMKPLSHSATDTSNKLTFSAPRGHNRWWHLEAITNNCHEDQIVDSEASCSLTGGQQCQHYLS